VANGDSRVSKALRSVGRSYLVCFFGLLIMLLMLAVCRPLFGIVIAGLTPFAGADMANYITAFGFLFLTLAVWRLVFKVADKFLGHRTTIFRLDD